MADLAAELNRLAGTTGWDAPAAANKLAAKIKAGTAGYDLPQALCIALGVQGAGHSGQGAAKKLASQYGGQVCDLNGIFVTVPHIP